MGAEWSLPRAVADVGELGNDAARNWEKAVERNHAPMTVLTRTAGESRVIIESPTGERQSSPVVWNR